MAKKGSVQRNKKRIRMAKSLANKRSKFKKEIYNKELSMDERVNLVLKLAKLPRNSAQTRVRNRCNLTGRPRGYQRKMGLSRIMFRELAGKGMLPGVVKASW